MKHDVTLGDLAKDSITGFEGVVVAKTEWISGCDRLTLQPQRLDKEGGVKLTQTFDVTQLVLVRKAVIVIAQPETAHVTSGKRGGPRPEPAQHITPL